jgi:peptidoglycan/LPS O-acetylase OafA/YrhL
MRESVTPAAPGIYRTEMVTTPEPPAPAAPVRPPRDRYFDALRSAAIVRVVLLHMFWLPWLPFVFPSMGVMFALGGSLMAKSVERSAKDAVTSRVRRLVPALWAMGVVLIPAMLWHGWPDRPSWNQFVFWVIPAVEPPTSDWAEPAGGVLWYLVAYLWMVLLSPVLLRAYRRVRFALLPVPWLMLLAWDMAPVVVPEKITSAGTGVLTFVSCWMLGFAHRRGDLRKVPWAVIAGVALLSMAAATWWTFGHRGDDGVIDLSYEPIADGLYCFGFTLVLLRWEPTMTWLNRRRILNGFVNLANSRAVTIYLWHNIAITFCFLAADWLPLDDLGAVEQLAFFAIALVLLAGFIMVFGWVEDVAARRPVTLWPWGKVPASRPKYQVPEWSGPIWFE